ncbi:MAG TPA: DUF3987 domain-containing protein [Steroidobacteraceae bacterium]|nr:DUF3987 domain-containing protein [Steroidobacteraceae bacterium]
MRAPADAARIAPECVIAEQALLGGLMMEDDAWARVEGHIAGEHMSRPDHAVIFEAIETLARSGKPRDQLTVSYELEARGQLEGVGGLAYVSSLTRDTPTAANVRAYADIVRKEATLRGLREWALGIVRSTDDRLSPGQIVASVAPQFERLLSAAASADEAVDWPEPTNFLRQFTAPPFTAELLPPELARYPALFAEAAGVDPGIALVSALAVAAAAIDDRIQVCANPDSAWFQQARFWVLTVAEPGGGKTPTQRAMLAPLIELHQEFTLAWEKERDRIAAENPKAENPNIPPQPRVIVSDVTTEALSEVLRANPRGVIVTADEFDAWLGSLDTYKGTGTGTRDRGEWLRAFDGGPTQIERVRRGSVFVPNWGVSILTASTPAAISRLARALPSDGLIQRFIIVMARRRRINQGSEASRGLEAERTAYRETIRRMWAVQPRAHNGVVQLSPRARITFDDWRISMLRQQEAFGCLEPALEAHIAKHETLLLRVALTYHVAETVNLAEGARDPAAQSLQSETLERAIAFMRRVADHAVAFYVGRQDGSEGYEIARAGARLILAMTPAERSKGLQRRDLLRRVKAFYKAREPEQELALRLLSDFGWIRASDDEHARRQKHGQPTRYDINPRLATLLTAEAEAERERRAIVRERIAESVEMRREESP